MMAAIEVAANSRVHRLPGGSEKYSFRVFIPVHRRGPQNDWSGLELATTHDQLCELLPYLTRVSQSLIDEHRLTT